MSSATPVFAPDGTPAALTPGATYTLCATLPDGRQLSDTGLTFGQITQALTRASGLGITVDRVIVELPISDDALRVFGA